MGGEPRNARPRPDGRQMMQVENFGCKYRGNDWTVDVNLERGRDKEGVEAYWKTLAGVVKQTTSSDAKVVPGLGDKAYWGPISSTNGILHVVVGTDVLFVQTFGKTPGAGSLEKTRAIMEKVLANYKAGKK